MKSKSNLAPQSDSKPIRVALIANSFTPGGAESYLYRLYDGLVGQGLVEVSLIGHLPDWPRALGPVIPIGVAAKLTRQSPVLPQLRSSLSNAFKVRRVLGSDEFDLVHMQYSREKLVLSNFFTRRLPVLWTEHGPLAPNFPRAGLPLLRLRARHAHVISVSEAVRSSLAAEKIPSKVVWNPLPDLNIAAESCRENGQKSGYVLYAGRIHIGKRLDLLLAAAALLPNIRIMIAGDGPDLSRLRIMAPANVEFLGHLEDLREVMAGCLAVISTSGLAAREGSPMVVLEARNLGIPVLMANDCHAAGEAEQLGARIYSPTAAELAHEIAALGTTLKSVPLPPVERHERSEAQWLRRTYRMMTDSVRGA